MTTRRDFLKQSSSLALSGLLATQFALLSIQKKQKSKTPHFIIDTDGALDFQYSFRSFSLRIEIGSNV